MGAGGSHSEVKCEQDICSIMPCFAQHHAAGDLTTQLALCCVVQSAEGVSVLRSLVLKQYSPSNIVLSSQDDSVVPQ
jgi:hypothetical protein